MRIEDNVEQKSKNGTKNDTDVIRVTRIDQDVVENIEAAVEIEKSPKTHTFQHVGGREHNKGTKK